MKRHGYLFDRVVAFDNLLLSAHKTCLGKKANPAVARLYFNLEPELFRLQAELRSGSLNLG